MDVVSSIGASLGSASDVVSSTGAIGVSASPLYVVEVLFLSSAITTIVSCRGVSLTGRETTIKESDGEDDESSVSFDGAAVLSTFVNGMIGF